MIVRVGSRNEVEHGKTGFAHFFEHMMFQGSKNYNDDYLKAVDDLGASNLNGSTNADRTNYYEVVPSNQLEAILFLEADRMGNLLEAMTQEKLDTQRDVVKNERRWSVDNQPYGTWWERLPALAYPPSHPFHHSLIGSMEDLTAASLEDVDDGGVGAGLLDAAVAVGAAMFERGLHRFAALVASDGWQVLREHVNSEFGPEAYARYVDALLTQEATNRADIDLDLRVPNRSDIRALVKEVSAPGRRGDVQAITAAENERPRAQPRPRTSREASPHRPTAP